jgi:tetratricopeptide (TPR) repeat protein/predicted Ser/Thr protein kinase
MNDAQEWRRMQALFHEAVALPAAERAPFLSAACAGDEALAQKVLAMLREDEHTAGLLDVELAEVAAGLFANGESEALPREVGRYRIVRRLGEGGMGVVYLAEREDVGGLVALKVLRDSWVSAERRERFAKEQQFLASLEHSSIARLYDAGTLADGTPYFVMEYVEGVPLVDYCEHAGASLEARLALFRCVCEAVQYAHGRALIHRDLKPSNVLVRTDGGVRLLDFGIAKQLSNDEGNLRAEMTQGMAFMTPAYAAPEQLGKGTVGLYTDIYSLGVILYRLLTGSLPFELDACGPSEVVRVVMEQAPVRPSLKARDQRSNAGVRSTRAVWADLDVMLLKALHKDPAQRYATVDALIRDIDHFLRHEPLEARPDSLGYRLRKFVRRQRVPLALATVVLASVVALVVFFTARLTRAKNEALAEVARTQRVEHFMERLFQGGTDEEAVPDDSLRVVTLVERGIREARALDRDPAVQAELFTTLGGISGDLGRFEQAETLLRAALDKRRALFGPKSVEVAQTDVTFGTVENDDAHFDEAEKLARDAVSISAALDAEHPLRPLAESLLARVLIGRGNYAEAVPLLKSATLQLERRGDKPFEYSVALGDLANVEYYLGEYATAKDINVRVLALDKRTFGDTHANVASDLINLGCIEQEFGSYAQAERLFREALAISESWYGANHYMTASNLGLLARALINQDHNQEASELLYRALKIDEAVFPDANPKLSIILHDLGTSLRNLGRLDEARADFERMLEIERHVHGEEHERVGLALSDLASIAAARKDYPQAEKQLRDALAIDAKRLPAGHVRIGEARVALGHVLLAERRYTEAAAESSAGYDSVSAHGTRQPTAARNARRDLVDELTALGKPEDAARFR